MDVGFYLGELLMQQGEVSVPGLGYFVQVRVSGYYNEDERKFYPPYHQAQFDVQSIDDDSLAEYIANKKNISVASARYFCEKYITNLKQQAAISEVQIGNLGWFYTELSVLTFKPAEKIIDDTIFYGFEPISINKADDVQQLEERPKVELNFPPRFTQTPPPVPVHETTPVEEPTFADANVGTYETTLPGQLSVPDPEAATQFTATDNYQPGQEISNEFFEPVEEEEEERKSPLLLVTVIVLFIVFIGLAVFALYRFKPDTFDKLTFWKKEVKDTVVIKPKQVMPSKVDTTVIDTTRFVDTAENNIDTIVNSPAASSTQTKVITQPTAAQPAATANTKVVTPSAGTPTTVVAPAAKGNTVSTPNKNTAGQQPITKTTIVSPPTSAAAISTVPVNKKTSTRLRSSDATGTRRFEVYVSPACKDMAQANRLITKLKNKGLDPRIVTDGAGPLIHISIGHFKTAQEARAFAIKAQESGKVAGDAYPNEIIPQ